MKNLRLLPFFFVLFLTDCTKNEPKPVTSPELGTSSVSSITQTGATSGGTITSEGNGSISERGIVWGTASGPTTSLPTKSSDGAGPGSFISAMTGLTPATKYFVRAYATNKAGTAYGNELTFETLTPPPPMITGFSPSSGMTGTSVTIIGTNFSTIAADNIVKFNGVTATIEGSPTTTSITTRVPIGAVTGKISVETGGQATISTVDFVILAPAITSFSPTSGMAGTSVTITGSNFSTIAANNIVKFGGIAAVISGSPTSTSIVAVAPVGVVTGKLTVEVGGQTCSSTADFVVLPVFTLKNGSFEEGSISSLTDWSPSLGVGPDNSMASAGTRSVKFSAVSPGGGCYPLVLQQQVSFSNLIPGELYKMTFKYKSDFSVGSNVSLGLSDFLMCSGCTGPGGLSTIPISFDNTASWQTFSSDVQAPTMNKIYYLTLEFCVFGVTGNIWVDELTFVKK